MVLETRALVLARIALKAVLIGWLTASGAWAQSSTATGSLNIARRAHQATLLLDGRVLVSAGYDVSNALTATVNDSGPLAVDYAAGMPVAIRVSVRFIGCTAPPQDANVVVQYKGR